MAAGCSKVRAGQDRDVFHSNGSVQDKTLRLKTDKSSQRALQILQPPLHLTASLTKRTRHLITTPQKFGQMRCPAARPSSGFLHTCPVRKAAKRNRAQLLHFRRMNPQSCCPPEVDHTRFHTNYHPCPSSHQPNYERDNFSTNIWRLGP